MRLANYKSNILWKILLRIYAVYTVFVFFILTIFLFPFFVIASAFNWSKMGLVLNRYWALLFFFFVGIKMEITYKKSLNKQSNYIFCPNHFSFLDIAILPCVALPFKFVGKISIVKVPLVGYVFKKFHITVDRSKLRDRYATYKKSSKALEEGFSLVVFPEGGITTTSPPNMSRFKDGPFRMAIETGTQLVPVTLADNWHIFPNDGKYYFRRRKCRMVVHEPIDPTKYTIDMLKQFQEDVHGLIQSELNRMNPSI